MRSPTTPPSPPSTLPPVEAQDDQKARSHARRNGRHGQRLTAAFEALEHFPALVESRERSLNLINGKSILSADLVAAIESDVALVTSVLRRANRQEGPSHRHVENVVDALNILSVDDLRQALSNMDTFDFFERGGVWHSAPVRFRLHALSTQQAAERLARMMGYRYRDRLLVTSLLHDIGKLALMHAYPGYPRQVHGNARTPEERLEAERELLGVDHALVGGVLARRWGLPNTVAKAIERHHSDSQSDDAPVVRLADMLAHYAHGSPVSHAKMVDVAREVGLSPAELRQLMFELPYAPEERHRTLDPCPLSGREVEVLRRLGEGKVYKQIAKELNLSTSTVRTHLHNIYGKLGAVDRAQAVLVANARGWL